LTLHEALRVREREVSAMRKCATVILGLCVAMLVVDGRAHSGGCAVGISAGGLIGCPLSYACLWAYNCRTIEMLSQDLERFAEAHPLRVLSSWGPPRGLADSITFWGLIAPLVIWFATILLFIPTLSPETLDALGAGGTLLPTFLTLTTSLYWDGVLWRRRGCPRVARLTGVDGRQLMELSGHKWTWLWGWIAEADEQR